MIFCLFIFYLRSQIFCGSITQIITILILTDNIYVPWHKTSAILVPETKYHKVPKSRVSVFCMWIIYCSSSFNTFFFSINTFGKPLSEKCIALLFLTQKRYHIDCGFKAKKKFLYSSSIFYIIFHGKWFIKRVGAYLDRCIIFVLHTICMRFFPLIWMWERLQIAFQWISPVSIWF